jgi:hypothetical protein
MNPSDLNLILGATAALLVTLGGGAKWLLMYIDAQQTKGELAEAAARNELSVRLYEEIRVLRLELSNSHAEKRLYLRRIFQLESFIHAQEGLMMPIMDGWPPA